MPFQRVLVQKGTQAWLEFQLDSYDAAVQHINHYAMETPPMGVIERKGVLYPPLRFWTEASSVDGV